MIRGARQGLRNLRRRAIARPQSTCWPQKLLRQQRASQGQANALQSAEPSELMQRPRTFTEFWPHYVLAHRHPVTRLPHHRTLLAWGLVVATILLRNGWLVLAALVVPYALAWFSHFFVEHNRPATFGHPLWSWLADQKMVALMLAGKMGDEVRRRAEQA